MQNQLPGTNSWHISKQWVDGQYKQQKNLDSNSREVTETDFVLNVIFFFFFFLLLKIIKAKKICTLTALKVETESRVAAADVKMFCANACEKAAYVEKNNIMNIKTLRTKKKKKNHGHEQKRKQSFPIIKCTFTAKISKHAESSIFCWMTL